VTPHPIKGEKHMKVEDSIETLAVSPIRAAEIIGLTFSTLEKDRRLGHLGIPFIKAGRRVVYRLADLKDWLEEHKQTTHINGA
jgi:integrase